MERIRKGRLVFYSVHNSFLRHIAFVVFIILAIFCVDLLIGSSEAATLDIGSDHAMAIRSDNTLWAWGANSLGQLGLETTSDWVLTPTQVGSDNDWVAVACGGWFSMGIKSDGTLWTWGSNVFGQLGNGTVDDLDVPTQIGTDTDWKSITGGGWHALATKTDDSLWAWGRNDRGQLGTGSASAYIWVPTQVSSSSWKFIAAGSEHSIGIQEGNTLWTWGYNFYGQLGNGKSGASENINPTPTPLGSGWKMAAAGGAHTIAIKQDGTLWGWGMNQYGEIGDGTDTQKETPAKVGTDTDWAAVGCGHKHSYALKTGGTLWSWGYNSSGQLGIGSTSGESWSPYQEAGMDTEWQAIAAGTVNDFSLALKSNGTIWATGQNLNGQIGDGTRNSGVGMYTQSLVPNLFNPFSVYLLLLE